MAQYQKKPIIVEANQFINPITKPWPQGVEIDGFRCYVITIHGQRAYLADGDWVITELDGVHHYPCKSDIFAKTFELVI